MAFRLMDSRKFWLRKNPWRGPIKFRGKPKFCVANGFAEAALALTVFLLVFGVLFLTYSGYPISDDERAIFAIASRWQRTGVFSTSNPFAGDEEPFAPLALLPWLWISDGLHVGRLQAAMLSNIAVTAGTAALLFSIVRSLTFSLETALLTAFFYAFCTIAWPYSQRLFREPLAGALLLLALGAPYLLRRYKLAGFLVSGAALAAAVFTKQSAASALLGMLWVWVAMEGVKVLFYQTDRVMRTIVNMTLSPGKGLLVYSPALILALAGFPRLWQEQPDMAVAVGLVALVHILGYGTEVGGTIWWGGLNWGPRFLVPIVPLIMIAAAPAIEGLGHKRWGRVALAIIGALALFPQLSGVLVDIRKYEGVLHRNVYLVAGNYHRAMAQVAWDLRYNPILGQWRMLREGELAIAWTRATGPEVALPLGVALGIVGVSLAIIWRVTACGQTLSRRGLISLFAIMLFLPVMTVASLWAVRNDPQLDFHENSRYLSPLIAQLNREAAPGDALLITTPYFTDYFLNWLRAPVEWEIKPSKPAPLDESSATALQSLLRNYRRIWLMRPLNRWSDSEPGLEIFLLDHAYKVKEYTYEDWMRLLFFLSPGGESVVVRRSIGWQNGIQLEEAAVEGSISLSQEIPSVVTLQSNDSLKLSLTWHGTREALQSWKVFVHIGLPDAPPLLQQDRLPRDGWWLDLPEGDTLKVVDRYGFLVNLPPGRYVLRVGFYNPVSGERVPCSEGDSLTLAFLDVR